MKLSNNFPPKYIAPRKFDSGCCLNLGLKVFCGSLGKLVILLHRMVTVKCSCFALYKIVKIDNATGML